MTRAEILAAAHTAVTIDRAATHGGVEDNFNRISGMWTAYLGAPVTPCDVSIMMQHVKHARAKSNPDHNDNWVDMAGYAACGGELATQSGAHLLRSSSSDHIVPGTPFGGGFYAGEFLLEGKLFALIVAPKAEGEAKLKWKTSETTTKGARSLRDGLSNSDTMYNEDHSAAKFCRDLTIGGFDDWYLPSRHEAALLAETLMPGEGYVPEQTTEDAFKEGGPEAFEKGWYWTSTEFSSDSAWGQYFDDGSQTGGGKGAACRVRAVRK